MTPPHGMTPSQLHDFLTNLGRFGIVVSVEKRQNYDFLVNLHALHRDDGIMKTAVIRQAFDFSTAQVSDILRGLNKLTRELASNLDLQLASEEQKASTMLADIFGPEKSIDMLFRRLADVEQRLDQRDRTLQEALDVLEGFVEGDRTATHVINIARSSIA